MIVEIDAARAAQAQAALPVDQPVHMLNLLRFREQATYAGDSSLPPCSGREAYFGRYIPQFREITAGQGIRAIWLGTACAELAGTAGSWDMVALVEYPNFAAFRAATESARYKRDAEPHRLAALQDWRLIATIRADIP